MTSIYVFKHKTSYAILISDWSADVCSSDLFRIHATDAQGNYVSLVYFGRNSGWARKLLPLHEKRFISGKLESYGQELQIIHPDYVLPPEESGDVPEREPVYGLSEGLTNNRLRQLEIGSAHV